MLKEKILSRNSGILLYGLTPPKHDNTPDKFREIAQKQVERINSLPVDGLILYDIQDESGRTDLTRPFPFMQTLDPQEYSENYLKGCSVPSIIYKCVGKYSLDSFTSWLDRKTSSQRYSVFVGAASKNQSISLSMKQAYSLRQIHNPDIILGGVTIPERHIKNGDEHLRIIDKINNGCQFFVSQCVYNLDASRDMLSDLYYFASENNIPLVPVIFTLTPCGSVKTLQFMEWLGISIPKWLKNDLIHSGDILSKSMDICKMIADELIGFSKEKGIPVGFNIESVAIRKSEIEASIELLNYVVKSITPPPTTISS